MFSRMMMSVAMAAVICLSATAQTAAKPAEPVTLRSRLVAQLHSTHDKADWFTPLDAAVAGMTPAQARWVPTNAAGKLDPNDNHSVGMLLNHIVFWNERALLKLQGKAPGSYDGNNDETFNKFDEATWSTLIQRMDAVMKGLEDYTEHCSEADLEKNAQTLSNISTHNAYHTGQILYVRKLQGSWNPANGVK